MQRESRARAVGAADIDSAFVAVHQLANHRQAEAEALVFARGRSIDLIETIEDMGEVFGRNADAGIADLYRHVICGAFR